MTRKLVAVGNSRGIILDRKILAQAGLEESSEVEVIVEGGRIIIEATTPDDPIEALRAKLAGVDPSVLDAVLTAATHKVRAESIKTLRRRRAG